MASNIGIKIANGDFYPILEENSTVKKRLILTTVHDNQPSVQIDLYRSAACVMTDAQHIGSLVVDKIKPKPKKAPSIEMIISSNSNGDIAATVVDLDAGAGAEHYTLNVSLKSLDETSRDMELPDFELDSAEKPSLYKRSEEIRQQEKEEKKGSSKMWIFVLIGLIIILGLAAVWLFLFGGLEYFCSGKKSTVTESTWYEPLVKEPAKEPEPVKQPEPVQPIVEPTPVIQAPPPPAAPKEQTSRKRPLAPVASYKVPATIPKDGVDYKIRWGDTLWDISEAFYRDPWLYPRIARHNKIRNPDLIISGRTIRIPPKN